MEIMKKSAIFLAFATLVLLSPNLAAQSRAQLFREAQDLYRSGSYGQAAALFDKLEDPFSKAYSILCASKLNSTNHDERMSKYMDEEPSSVLDSRIHMTMAGNLLMRVIMRQPWWSSAKLTLLCFPKRNNRNVSSKRLTVSFP